MSTLIAIAYPDTETAEQVRSKLIELVEQHVIELEDAVVVTRNDEGKVRLNQSVSTAGVGAAGGAVWGGLIGLLFLAPLLGMAVGAAAGGISGALTDVGVNDDFMKHLGSSLTPGHAALILLIRSVTPDKVLPEVQAFGGEIIQTSLDNEDEERLRELLDGKSA